MRFVQLVFAALIVLTMTDYCLAKTWRGIVPLKSTRADVERLLGPSVGQPPRYYLPDSTVYFQYANCRCGEKCKTDAWNVPPDTVTLIRVGMKGVVKLADLNIDLTNFKKWRGDEDVPGAFIFKNDEEGFAVETGGGYVSALTYFPPTTDDHLRCPPNKGEQKYDRNCSPSVFSIECSSEFIKRGDTVECRVRFTDLRRDTAPIVEWKVAHGVSVRRNGALSVKIRLTDRRPRKIPIMAKAISPKVCFGTVSWALTVVKDR